MGGCVATVRRHSHLSLFQSTHPHMVRRVCQQGAVLCLHVSIHAPIQGATGTGGCNVLTALVSIHAPIQGATPVLTLIVFHIMSFNPRTHIGCDSCSPLLQSSRSCFNPRTHIGCDLEMEFRLRNIPYVSIHAPI